MTSFTINFNVNVRLEEATMALIEKVVYASAAAKVCAAKPDEVKNLCDALHEPEAEAAPVQSAKPQQSETESEAAEAPAPEPVQAPAEDVDPELLFKAVRSAQRERHVAAQSIKSLYKEFGIESTKDCPAERRAELLSRLNAL